MHKKSENFSESINISKKKSLKFVTFYSLKMSPNLVKIIYQKKLINKNFYKKIAKIGDNFLTGNVTKIGEKSFTKKIENFSESTKMSIKDHQNCRKFKGITKIGDNFVENECGLLYVANCV